MMSVKVGQLRVLQSNGSKFIKGNPFIVEAVKNGMVHYRYTCGEDGLFETPNKGGFNAPVDQVESWTNVIEDCSKQGDVETFVVDVETFMVDGFKYKVTLPPDQVKSYQMSASKSPKFPPHEWIKVADVTVEEI